MRRFVLRATLIALTTLSSATAVAASATLEEVERAYANVDFQAAYDAGLRVLALGTSTFDECVRLHVVVAISAAALENPEVARRHFTLALAMDPKLELERELSPKLRGPYLEARGALASLGRALGLEGVARPASRRLVLGLTDPLAIARKVELALWPIGAARPEVRTLPAARTIPIELPPAVWASGFEYWARVVDAQGNPLFELGHETEPVSVRALGTTTQASATPPVAPVIRARAPSPWLPIALGSLGAVALGAGGYFNWQREQKAKDWNSAQCEQAGRTRYQQCESVDDSRRRSQLLAISGYAVGGALLTGALITWLSRPAASSSREQAQSLQLECGSSLTALDLHCSGRF